MKKIILIFIAILMMAGSTTKVMSQILSMKVNQAQAEVISAIGLTAINPLEFGGFSSGAIGTVVISPLSARTSTGGVTLVSTSITPTAASYTMTGSPYTHYAIVLPIVDVIITRVGNGATMVVNNFTCSYPLLASTTGSASTDAFTVGATLNVGNSQVSGTYVGPFEVTVVY